MKKQINIKKLQKRFEQIKKEDEILEKIKKQKTNKKYIDNNYQ